MYTPPVTPWESEMPEVCDPTPGAHDQKKREHRFGRSMIPAKRKEGSGGRAQQGEGAAEGRSDDWGEVVTR